MRFVLLGLAVLACNGESPTPDEPKVDAFAVRILDDSQTYQHQSGRSWPMQLLKITRSDGVAAFAQWIPSDIAGPGPVVVVALPYNATPWSGEALDSRWQGYQANAHGQFPDVDGPAWDGESAIVYVSQDPLAVAAGQATIHLFNDFSVLLVYPRFYAGGALNEHIADMGAALRFLETAPAVDSSRVALLGASLGGFDALFGATQARAGIVVKAVAALYPPSDLEDWVTYATTEVPLDTVQPDWMRTFLSPYVERIRLAAKGLPAAPGANYTGLTASALCDIDADVLLPHDSSDSLVPRSLTQSLVATCASRFMPLYWERGGTINYATQGFTHGPIADGALGYSAADTFAQAFMYTRLAAPNAATLVLYDPTTLTEFFTLLHAYQSDGGAISWATARVQELADPRMSLVNATTGDATTGAAFVANTVNALWGTIFTANNVRTSLEDGMPSP